MYRSIAAALLLCSAAEVFAQTQPTAPPPFVVLEVKEGTRAFTNVTTPDVAIPLTFVEQQGKKIAIVLDPTPLLDSAGNQVTPEIATTFDLAPREAKRIWLKASLPIGGTYEATIRTKATAAKAKPVSGAFTISVARTIAAVPITVAPIAPQQITNVWNGSAEDAPIETQLYSTGAAVTLAPPFLFGATTKPKGDSAAGTKSTMQFAADQKQIRVSPAEAGTLTGKLTHIERPGRYDGKLRFARAGYTPVDVDLTVYVRESRTVAFLFILLGVLISVFVHGYASSLRPRLLVQQHVDDLRQRLAAANTNAAGDPDAVALVKGVEQSMRAEWELLRSRRTAVTNELDVYDTIVPAVELWIGLHRQLGSVRPRSVAAKLMPTLTTARNAFVADRPDEAKVKTSIEELKALPGRVDAEVVTELTAELDKLDGLVKGDSRAEAVAIRNTMTTARGALPKDIARALTLYGKAREQYNSLLAADLRARVEVDASQPPGVEKAEWEKLKEDTRRSLDVLARETDAETATALLKNTITDYVRRIAAAFTRSAAKFNDATRTQIEKALEPIDGFLTAGDLANAWKALDAAQQLVGAASQAMGPAAANALAAAAGAPSTGFDIVAIFDRPPSWDSFGGAAAGARTRAAITAFDLLISVIVLIASTIAGLQVLWIPNETWGGFASYVAAFLWGFAIDQFTHAGVAALVKNGK